MHTEAKISEGLYYVGGSDRRLALFENVYPLSNGASYNSYLYLDEKTLLLDTVDSSISSTLWENLEHLLKDRPLDYLIVNHMEPDHAANIGELLLRHPETTIVINAMAKRFLLNFFPNIKANFLIVKEGDTLNIGKHTFTFVFAQMVHWPEVMFTYETSEKVLFSADAFGTFGALSGDIFASSNNFDMAEARRYYTNIVGKYGDQVLAVLKKAATIDIKMICPLHGPIHTGNLNPLLKAYANWATYTPEEKDGVIICYSSVYGDTASAAMALATKLAERDVHNLSMYDVSKTDSSYLIAESFRVGTIVLAATTYNNGVFVKMEDFLHDLANHQIRDRNIAIMENGSWAPSAKKNMKAILENLKGIEYIEKEITINSALKEAQLSDLDILADQIAEKVLAKKAPVEGPIDKSAIFKLSYGLYGLFTKDENGRDNASINNSFIMISSKPGIYLLSVSPSNYTEETITKTGIFNISVLDSTTDFSLIKRLGFASGRDTDKFADGGVELERSSNGLLYLKEQSNSYMSFKVLSKQTVGDHSVFLAEMVECRLLNNNGSLTYADYFDNVKPTPIPTKEAKTKKVGWRCKICGYTYWGEKLPDGFVCPLCKHGVEDFERIEE